MKKIKLCKVRLNYSVEYYVAANDNKEETAISIAETNTSFKLGNVLGSTFNFNNGEIIESKETEYINKK
jgi:hypothetical protein